MHRSLLTLAIAAAAVGTAVAQTASSSGNAPSTGTSTLPSGRGGSGNSMGTGAAGGSTSVGEGTEAPNMANSAGEQMGGAALTAKKAIERDGYKNVQGIAKGSDGLWHAQAIRGSTPVQVTVDRSGMVSVR